MLFVTLALLVAFATMPGNGIVLNDGPIASTITTIYAIVVILLILGWLIGNIVVAFKNNDSQ